MLDYEDIRELARSLKRPAVRLIALSEHTDPFYAGVERRRKAAEWFARIFREHGSHGAHLRRIHYVLVSQPDGSRVPKLDGAEYQNTLDDWNELIGASLAARYLGLIPADALVDRRNEEPMDFAAKARTDGEVSAVVLNSGARVDVPAMPILPFYSIDGFDTAGQGCVVEVWIEKSTQNDWLVPLCRRRGVRLVVGIGEQSETRSRELAFRAAEDGVPVRVLYIADFDPTGRSIPKAMARKVEFTAAKNGLSVDVQVIPVALTPEQCREYDLPRTPIKEGNKAKDKFERTFGVGATELDALEALHPGELARLLEAEIDNFLDASLDSRVRQAEREQEMLLWEVRRHILARHKGEV
jgi:hypothetical protein